jgi:hypothetical protein
MLGMEMPPILRKPSATKPPPDPPPVETAALPAKPPEPRPPPPPWPPRPVYQAPKPALRLEIDAWGRPKLFWN